MVPFEILMQILLVLHIERILQFFYIFLPFLQVFENMTSPSVTVTDLSQTSLYDAILMCTFKLDRVQSSSHADIKTCT